MADPDLYREQAAKARKLFLNPNLSTPKTDPDWYREQAAQARKMAAEATTWDWSYLGVARVGVLGTFT